ncbi:MAG TPA: exodeoxyribonuclease V subunit alpha [Polyangiaceae bacterium]
MSQLWPFGTARARFERGGGIADAPALDPEQVELAFLGTEVARLATGLSREDQRALADVAAATLAAVRAGSTRVPIASLGPGARLVERARDCAPGDPVAAVIGRAGDRTPLVVEGDWLYSERMRLLEERFCALVRARLADTAAGDARGVTKALKAVADGPPALTDEQKRAVRAALTAPMALVTGGPGTGKTTIVLALLRALAWTGLPLDAIAIAAPTGKAAQRLQQSIAAGLAATRGDISDAALRSAAPAPQTVHRLLGWSPGSGRFARHENDPLPHRVVIVDEASMIDLALMDRLLRALRSDARLVLLGDADQLPSIEAGAVFRDLCQALGSVRLTTNLRVARDADARRIVDAAQAINAGAVDDAWSAAVTPRASVSALSLAGVEHLRAPWSDVADDLLDLWWQDRVDPSGDLARLASRVFHTMGGIVDAAGAPDVQTLFDHHARARILCATRIRGIPTSTETLNDALLRRLGGGVARGVRWRGRSARTGTAELAPGAPVLVERNDYERALFNGDQGVVLRVAEAGGAAVLAAVFPRGDRFEAFPLDTLPDLAPAFAVTVHKSQGSEFDHVALVLPETDMPLLTRELLYTAVTRARRSVLLVGSDELLARAVTRTLERHSGIAERLAATRK